MALLCMALADLGVEAVSFTGSQVGIITDAAHTKAKILEVKGDRVREALAAGKVAVVPASRASPPSGRSPPSAGAAPTPRRWRWRRRSRPTRARSTPT